MIHADGRGNPWSAEGPTGAACYPGAMDRRNLLIGVVIAAVLATAVVVAVWPDPSDEEQVREAIRAVAAGARDADLAATLAPVSADYSDAQGVTRDGVKLYLFREFQRRGPIVVMLGAIDVTLAGDIAMAEFGATLADGVDASQLDFIPGDAETVHFVVDLEREDGDWLIVGSRYDRSTAWPR